MEWFVAHDSKKEGPFSDEQLHLLAETGELKADYLVWRRGLSNWLPAHKIPGLLTPPLLDSIDSATNARGWLLFAAVLIGLLWPLRLMGQVALSVIYLKDLLSAAPPGGILYIGIIGILRICLAANGVFSGYGLWQVRPNSLASAKRFLKRVLAFGFVWPLFWYLPTEGFSAAFIGAYLIELFWSVVFFSLCWISLKRTPHLTN